MLERISNVLSLSALNTLLIAHPYANVLLRSDGVLAIIAHVRRFELAFYGVGTGSLLGPCNLDEVHLDLIGELSTLSETGSSRTITVSVRRCRINKKEIAKLHEWVGAEHVLWVGSRKGPSALYWPDVNRRPPWRKPFWSDSIFRELVASD